MVRKIRPKETWSYSNGQPAKFFTLEAKQSSGPLSFWEQFLIKEEQEILCSSAKQSEFALGHISIARRFKKKFPLLIA